MPPTTSAAAADTFDASVTCYLGEGYDDRKTFPSLQAAWKAKPLTQGCDVEDWTDVNPLIEATIQNIAKSRSDNLIQVLAGMCGERAGYPVDFVRSDEQADEATAMLALCPNHPDAAKIKANIKQARKEVKEAEQLEKDRTAGLANGTWADEGSHLVGPDIKAGKWQSVGDKVEDCYWEVSDSEGNIIDNNFISIAPQFTITIPASAAGFTNNGCEFRKIG